MREKSGVVLTAAVLKINEKLMTEIFIIQGVFHRGRYKRKNASF